MYFLLPLKGDHLIPSLFSTKQRHKRTSQRLIAASIISIFPPIMPLISVTWTTKKAPSLNDGALSVKQLRNQSADESSADHSEQ
jgi:hypothetical protein